MKIVLGSLALLLFVSQAFAESCIYRDDSGMYQSASSREAVPAAFRLKAKCRTASAVDSPEAQPNPSVRIKPSIGLSVNQLRETRARTSNKQTGPDTVELHGNERREELSTSLGVVQVRWTRDIEPLFAKTPRQQVAAAWRAAAKLFQRSAFPRELRTATYDWNVIFMYKASNVLRLSGGGGSCHPGYMRPPANIYIDARSIVHDCFKHQPSPAEATKILMRTLVHELGHAAEFQFVGKGFSRVQRWHSEGFARWVEAKTSGSIPGALRAESEGSILRNARAHFDPRWRPQRFNGSGVDYARAYALIATIADGRSLSTLRRVYGRMDKEIIPLTEAVHRELGWSTEQWMKETATFLNIGKR